jgi:hypothetical protein
MNHISRVTGQLASLPCTQYVCRPTSIVRIGPGSAYRAPEDAIAGLSKADSTSGKLKWRYQSYPTYLWRE